MSTKGDPARGKHRKGYKHTEETIEKIKNSRIKYCNENNHNWKGDEAGYVAKHRWANRVLGGKPDICPICKNRRKIDLCNVDHKYRRVIEDWFYACHQCHVAFDSKHRI